MPAFPEDKAQKIMLSAVENSQYWIDEIMPLMLSKDKPQAVVTPQMKNAQYWINDLITVMELHLRYGRAIDSAMCEKLSRRIQAINAICDGVHFAQTYKLVYRKGSNYDLTPSFESASFKSDVEYWVEPVAAGLRQGIASRLVLKNQQLKEMVSYLRAALLAVSGESFSAQDEEAYACL